MKAVIFALLTISFSLFAFDAAKEFTGKCASCHTIGGGDKIGPDLAGVSKRRSLEWMHKFINYPDGMIDGDDEEPGYEKPDADAKALYALYKPQRMAEHKLSKEEVKAIVAYIDEQGKGKEPQGKILQLIKKK